MIKEWSPWRRSSYVLILKHKLKRKTVQGNERMAPWFTPSWGIPVLGGHVDSEVDRAPLSADCFWSSEFRALPQIWIRLRVLIRPPGIYVFNKPYKSLIEETLMTIAVTAEATRKVSTAMKSRFSKIAWRFLSGFYLCSSCIWKIAVLILSFREFSHLNPLVGG